MSNIFKGLLLITLDFYLDLGRIRIGLLPDFPGYILLIKGMEELAGESEKFAKAIPLAKVMVVYTAVLYMLDLFGISVQLNFWSWVLGIAGMIARLVVIYWLVLGVQDMEARHRWELQGGKLRSMWQAMAVLSVIGQLCSWIPYVAIATAIAGVIVNICFLVAFHGTKKRYEEQYI